MKKNTVIILIVVALALIAAVIVFTTRGKSVEGYVDFASMGGDGTNIWYDVCDPVLVGQVVQPAESASEEVHGVFTAGNSDFCPEYTTKLVGTCQVTLIPVESPGDPASKPGQGAVDQCTGDLAGLRGKMVINYDFRYQAHYNNLP
jgi:hypothetical protein